MTEREPSTAERHGLVDAAEVFGDHGIEFRFPWECDLDDREREMYEALLEACRAYSKWVGNGETATPKEQ